EQWTPSRHEYEQVKVDLSAVGPFMVRVAGEVADGMHVHPMHSMHYIRNRLLPGLAEGAARAGRDPTTIDKIIPVIVAAGDTSEARATSIKEAKTAIRLLRSHTELRLSVRRPRPPRPARPAARLPQDGRQRSQPSADHRRDPQPVAIVARWDDVADR